MKRNSNHREKIEPKILTVTDETTGKVTDTIRLTEKRPSVFLFYELEAAFPRDTKEAHRARVTRLLLDAALEMLEDLRDMDEAAAAEIEQDYGLADVEAEYIGGGVYATKNAILPGINAPLPKDFDE